MNYQTERNSITKIIKRFLGKIILLSILIMTAFICSIYFYSGKVKKIIKSDIQIENARIQSALKTFKEKTGKYPELMGKEDALNTVVVSDRRYSFDIFYGNEKLYAIPENLKEGVEKSNKIVTKRDNKGGWVYDISKGEISPNIDEKKY